MRICLVMLLVSILGCDPHRAPGRTEVAETMERRVRQALGAQGQARVLINLTGEPGQRIAEAQQRVLDALESRLSEPLLYRNVPALAGVLHPGGLERVLSLPEVASVQIDEPGGANLAEAVPAVLAPVVHAAYNWTGAGIRVAVLDSGIDTDHPDLADDLVAQQCFNSCPPGGGASGLSAEDDHGHGTAVSGIITSAGSVSATGFAPDAEIVAVRVLDSNIKGAPSRWIAGLDWVLTNLPTLKVHIINMSLGTYATYAGTCDAQQPALASVIKQLSAKGVTIFAASGNKGAAGAMDAPACISGVIAVGATYDSEMGRQPTTGTYPTGCFDAATGPEIVACFSNASGELDLLAPGVKTTSTYTGGGTVTWSGTSVASPAAAAVAALLLSCDPALTPSAIEAALEQSGPKVTDPKSGLSFPRIDALAAVNIGCACKGKPDGAPCHDGDLCTTDTCKAGACASSPKVCAAKDDCHTTGACDPKTGSCSQPIKPEGAACDDGDPCTRQDACSAAGACGGEAYTCAPTQCQAASTCDGKGGCSPTPMADKTPCDDGDPCTKSDTCESGTCEGGAPISCPAPDACREQGTCDPKTGACASPISQDGTHCPGGGTCKAGICVPPPDLGLQDVIPPDTAQDSRTPGDSSDPVIDTVAALVVTSPDAGNHDAGGEIGPGSGCSCEASTRGRSGAPGWWLALVLLGLARGRELRQITHIWRRDSAAHTLRS